MRAAVYQRNLQTYGGGERYTLDIARGLRDAGYDVDLLAPPGGSIEEAGRRFGADVDGIRQLELDPLRPCHDAAERSSRYDLYANATHASPGANLSPHGLMVVHFPQRPPPRLSVLAGATIASPSGVVILMAMDGICKWRSHGV